MSILVHSSTPTSTPEVSDRPDRGADSGKSGAGEREKDQCGLDCEAAQEVCAAPRFGEILRLFAEFDEAGDASKLFPKTCRVCGRNFRRFSEYLCATTPKGHVFEDCADVMKKPFTMVYRHCQCGNTLVLALTAENFPALDVFWSVLREEARKCARPLSAVVADFSAQCDEYVLLLQDPCVARERSNDNLQSGPGQDG